MTRRDGAAGLFAPAVLGVLAAVLAFAALSAAATPSHLKTRVAASTALADQADKTAPAQRRLDRWPAGAICSRSGPDEATALSRQIAGLAAAARVKPLDFKTQPEGSSNGQLIGVSLHFVGEGDQGAVLALLNALQPVTPTLFVDAVDLKPTVNGVRLDLIGRVWCWAGV